MSAGKFLTLEGGEGVGKTTQIRLLQDRLAQRGIDVLCTREPGGTPGAEEIRALLVTGDSERWDARCEALLLAAARADHVRRVIRPALAAGRWVLCDRYVDSTFVYQGVLGGMTDADLAILHDVATGGLWPEMTFVLDLPDSAGLARARQRNSQEENMADRFENKDSAFHHQLAGAFRARARACPDHCRLVDAQGTPDQVSERMWALVAGMVTA